MRSIAVLLLLLPSPIFAGLLDGVIGGATKTIGGAGDLVVDTTGTTLNAATGVVTDAVGKVTDIVQKLFTSLGGHVVKNFLGGNSAQAVKVFASDSTYTFTLDGKTTTYTGKDNVQKFYENEVTRGVKKVDFTVNSVGTEGDIIKTGGDVKVVKEGGSETGKYTVILTKIGGQYLLKDVVDTRKTD